MSSWDESWEPRPAWQAEALCRGTDPGVFYPERGAPTKPVRALRTACRSCVVRAACLEFALENGEHVGIWGGLPERSRRLLRRSGALATPEHDVVVVNDLVGVAIFDGDRPALPRAEARALLESLQPASSGAA